MRALFYPLSYLLHTRVLGRKYPFMGGLVLTEKCNLACRHCHLSASDYRDLSYEEVEQGLQIFRDMGTRSLFIMGGEPFLWRDGAHRLDQVISLARKMGFVLISVFTNGTCPLTSACDTLYVSLDGLPESHNRLRGNNFEKIMENLTASNHPNIIINYTINAINQLEIEQFCKAISSVKQIKGIFFYFHTPYYGFDDLFIPFPERQKIIQRLFTLKKYGYRILNSAAALTAVLHDSWAHPSHHVAIYRRPRVYQCCRHLENGSLCKDCGYLAYAEIDCLLRLKPTAILAALAYLPRKS